MPYAPKDATPVTARVNREAAAEYDFMDRQDFEDVRRGFIAPIPDEQVPGYGGQEAFNLRAYDYLADDGPVPETVNPSLWRQSQLITQGGLYRVTDRLYQVRGNDLGNLTVAEGDDGLVIIDTTTGIETARQGMQLIRRHVSDKPVAAVIYTHTHVDHYGGVEGVIDPADVADGKVSIIAPGRDFGKYAIGENVVAGNAMSRRAAYVLGTLLDLSPRGTVSCGMAVGVGGELTVSYLSPTDLITRTGERREIAGMTFEFLYAPDTEAPEEMHIWIPELRALTCAENANHSLHNIAPLRGARTRDARNFSRCLDETLERWGDEAEVHYGPHTWPLWGNQQIVEFLQSQRDTYKYIHDQSLRLANKGYSPVEAAEAIELPEQLGRRWYNRGYHGTLHDDVRAVFTKELGTWDGDPVSLHPLPPAESAKRYVRLIGAAKIIAEGRQAFEAGDYRWASELMHTLVFAEPDNAEARNLQADAYEQMGYQAEGPQWRGIFLTAARELRGDVIPGHFTTVSTDTVLSMPADILFDFVAVHLIGEKAAKADIRIAFTFTDLDETWTAWIVSGVLNARPGVHGKPRLQVTGSRQAIIGAVLKPDSAVNLALAGMITLEGDESVLAELAGMIDEFDPDFDVVVP